MNKTPTTKAIINIAIDGAKGEMSEVFHGSA